MMDDRARLVRAFFEASATATRFGGMATSHLISLTRPEPRLRGARPRGYPHACRRPAWWPVVEGGRVSRADKPARSKARRPPGSPSTSWSWTSSGPRSAAGQTWLKETASIQISPCDRGSYAEVVRPRSLAQGLDEQRKCIRVRVARRNTTFNVTLEFSPAGYSYRRENRNLFMKCPLRSVSPKRIHAALADGDTFPRSVSGWKLAQNRWSAPEKSRRKHVCAPTDACRPCGQPSPSSQPGHIAAARIG